MLPPFIIQQIRQREERQRREQQRPRLELPLERLPLNAPEEDTEADEDKDRGVIIVELM